LALPWTELVGGTGRKPVSSFVSGLPGRACKPPDVLVWVAGQAFSNAFRLLPGGLSPCRGARRMI